MLEDYVAVNLDGLGLVVDDFGFFAFGVSAVGPYPVFAVDFGVLNYCFLFLLAR